MRAMPMLGFSSHVGIIVGVHAIRPPPVFEEIRVVGLATTSCLPRVLSSASITSVVLGLVQNLLETRIDRLSSELPEASGEDDVRLPRTPT